MNKPEHPFAWEPAPGLRTLLTRTPQISHSQWQNLGWLSRWFVMVRGVVLVMTISAVTIGILAALQYQAINWLHAGCLLIGLTLAHACNNLLNDWTDQHMGVDQDNYFRRRYGTHVLLDGLVSTRAFLATTLLTGLVALAFGLYICLAVDMRALYLIAVGGFFVLFYTWPLKHFALGEIAVLLVWGPLLVGGSFFILTGQLNTHILLLSLVAGIGPTLVILGKHMDKFEWDREKQIRTLPVVIGLGASRTLCVSLLVMQWIMLLYLALAGSEYGLLTALLAGAAMLHLVRVMRAAPPGARPEDYPEDVWPLWYAAAGFRYSRDFGLCLVLGVCIPLVM